MQPVLVGLLSHQGHEVVAAVGMDQLADRAVRAVVVNEDRRASAIGNVVPAPVDRHGSLRTEVAVVIVREHAAQRIATKVVEKGFAASDLTGFEGFSLTGNVLTDFLRPSPEQQGALHKLAHRAWLAVEGLELKGEAVTSPRRTLQGAWA